MKRFTDPILQALPFPIWEEDYSAIKEKLVKEDIWDLESNAFRQTLKGNPNLVVDCIKLLKIVHINQACLDLYQVDSIESLSNFFLNNFLGNFHDSFIDELIFLNEGKTKFQLFEELTTIEKSKKNIQLEFVVMDSDLRQVIVQITDITKEVQSRKQIETLVKRNEMALKTTKAAVWEWDLITKEIYWSDEYYALFGIDPGRDKYGFEEWAEKIHPDDHQEVTETLEKALKDKSEYWEMEYRIQVPSKGYIIVIDRGTILLNESGEVAKMVGAIHDITQEKTILNQLIHQNKFIETVLEKIPIGVAANYIDTGKVKLINKNFTQIYGWSLEELSDVHSFFEKVYPDPDYRTDIKNQILSDISSGDPERMNWSGIEITTKNGQKRIVRATNIPLPEENLMISTVSDQTDLHKAIQELEQFAYIASHDLQEPLRMISSFLSLLQRKYERQLDEKAQSYINYAVDGANRMKDMINNLLEYSRANRLPEKIDLLNLKDVIMETQGLLKVLIEENQAEIIIAQEMPVVHFPKSLLIQVFQNLITNAIQNRKKDQRSIIQIRTKTTNQKTLVEVSDNGIGISPDKHEKIFQLFQSYGSNGDHKKRGIGLAICKKIIEKSGGDIWVKSDGKSGSSFFFTIKK
ncbi:MAG: sensor histidine kinase [Mongoliitalea sp.]